MDVAFIIRVEFVISLGEVRWLVESREGKKMVKEERSAWVPDEVDRDRDVEGVILVNVEVVMFSRRFCPEYLMLISYSDLVRVGKYLSS